MDNNSLAKVMDSIDGRVELNFPRWYRYTAIPILPAIQVTYLLGASYFVTKNLENSKILQATLPFYIMGVVTGAIMIHEGYCRAINGLAKLLFSNSKEI